MAEVFVFANQKGGVGKTTSTFNLGAALQDIDQRVLLVDLDPQASLTFYAGFDPESIDVTLHQCLTRDVPPKDIILSTECGMDLLPANMDLSLAELQMINLPARERRITRIVNAVRDAYDFVLLDSQPSLGILTLNALAAADQVIIPVSCEFLSLRGTRALLKLIAKVRGQLNSHLQIAGLLPTMFDSRTRHGREILQILRDQFSDLYLFPYTVNRSIRFAESSRAQLPVFEMSIQVPGALAYRELARDLVKKKERK